MLETMGTLAFWSGVAQVTAIDIVLGGDNAVVIALACRDLPEADRNKGIFWGVFGAVGLRIVLIYFALALLKIPFLKIGAALLLLWIGIKLLEPEHEGAGHEVAASSSLFSAVKTIVVADAVMSLDNVVGVAAAAKDQMLLIVFGIALSIPIIVWGSKIILKFMDRFPVVITIGAALIGWVAGEMLVSDIRLKDWVESQLPVLHWVGPAAGALFTVLVGKMLAARAPQRPLVDLGEG